MQRWMILCMVTVLAVGPVAASQTEPRTVFSPIAGKPFRIEDIPVEALTANSGAPDMGTDDDGCRHSSGINEYNHYVVTDPYNYFSAMSYEWGRDGRFKAELSPDFRSWVTSKDGFHTEWVTDKDKLYDRAQRRARAYGKQITPIHEWVIPQAAIPPENKYRYALMSYRKRGASDAFLGKLALTGAWALRVKMNRPLHDTRLKAGIEEVNERLSRRLEETDSFELDPVTEAYREVFRGSRLTDEGYFVAGITLVGLVLRQGDIQEATKILDRMMSRFDTEQDDMHMFFRGLIRSRQNTIRVDYLGFLETAARHFSNALAAEQFPRPKIPEIVLIVAECHRRMGKQNRAYDWYLALADLEEADQRLRNEIREQGRVPSVDAPYHVLLGWRADEKLRELTADGVVHSGKISGPDTRLLNAIVNEGLGTLEYESPTWEPRADGGERELSRSLKHLGLAILDFTKRAGRWPDSLGELWLRGVIADRNGYNRFHDPMTGAPLLYQPIGGPLENLPRETVLIATSEPAETNQGPRYVVFTAGLKVVWTSEALEPGEQVSED